MLAPHDRVDERIRSGIVPPGLYSTVTNSAVRSFREVEPFDVPVGDGCDLEADLEGRGLGVGLEP